MPDIPYALQEMPLKIAPFPVAWSRADTVHTPKARVLTGSAVLAQLTVVTNRHTCIH